jgi:tetratricopeptide (TPR) repeat protein
MVNFFLRGVTLMVERNSRSKTIFAACLCVLLYTCTSLAQTSSESDAIHELEVQLRARNEQVSGVRVRLLNQSRMLAIAETFSGREGQLKFVNLMPGEYLVETSENDRFEATVTRVTIIPIDFRKPRATHVTARIDLPPRKLPGMAPPGVVMADVDLNVPESALKHFRKGAEALRSGKTADAVKELKVAIEVYPKFYTARLELGRELRAEKRFTEAEETLKPLGEIAPRRAESRIEYAMVLLALGRSTEAANELRKALDLEEANWVTHLHLGWALLKDDAAKAEKHFARALELDERKAAQAHLSLARLAHARGMRQEAVRHLEAYLALAPNASDADAVRRLLVQLRK